MGKTDCVMNENPWIYEKAASDRLGVTEQTLQRWREIGYLKPGTHWRSSPDIQPSPWKPKVIYHFRWCKEMIEYWQEQDAPVTDLAA